MALLRLVGRYFAHGAAGLRGHAALLAIGVALGCSSGLTLAVPVVDAAITAKDSAIDAMAATLGYRAQVTSTKAGETVIGVVEFYNVGLKHYFITAEPAEIANLDGGAFNGAWKRTGRGFNAWPLAGKPADAVPVCRFFGTDQYRTNGTRIGPNSHFYTADPAECAFVKTGYQSVAADGRSYPAWTYEGDVFAVKLAVGGACPGGTQPLYRAYNDGANGDPNHRYSTDAAVLTAMAGWTFEGLVMCVPITSNTAPFDVRGDIVGCHDPACRPPLTAGSGGQLVDLIVEFGNSGNQPTTITIPAGFTFVSVSGVYQDGLLLDSITVQVPAGGTTRMLISLYCMQQTRGSATASAIYSATAVTTNPGLLAIIALPRPIPVLNESIKATITQFAVWEITDGKGTLSANQLNLLRTIYATPETEPAFFTAMDEFLNSLTVIKPN